MILSKEETSQFYSKYDNLVRATAYKYGFRNESIDDIVQDVFIKIMEKLHTVKDKNLITAWIIRITANHCINLQKKNKRYVVLDLEQNNVKDESLDNFKDDNFVCINTNGELEVSWEHLSGVLRQCIDRVKNENIRQVLNQRFIDNKKTKDIAKEVGVPENTVRSHIHKFRNSVEKSIIQTLVSAL